MIIIKRIFNIFDIKFYYISSYNIINNFNIIKLYIKIIIKK